MAAREALEDKRDMENLICTLLLIFYVNNGMIKYRIHADDTGWRMASSEQENR